MANYFVHDKALCESKQIGEGTRIWAFSHILPEAKLGARCNVGDGCFIENKVVIGNNCTIKNGISIWDEVTIEDEVFLGPSMVFTNDLRPRSFGPKKPYLPTLLKKGVTVGANATIVCGVTIGDYAMVGAGAVVTADVAPHRLVVGNPARAIGLVCFCGQTLKENGECPDCGKPLKEMIGLHIEKPRHPTTT